MIEVSIPEDIRKYEPTFLGPLTTRQTICATAMVCSIYATYFLEKAVGITDPMNAPFFLFFALPPFFIGWCKPYGMYFEKFVFKAFRENFLAPNKRPYKVDNMWDIILLENEYGADRIEKRKRAVTKEMPRNKIPEELRAYR